jgi:hypothetical protein
VITFQRKRANRRIVNEEGLLALLAEYGHLRVVEFNSSTSFAGEGGGGAARGTLAVCQGSTQLLCVALLCVALLCCGC